MDPLSAVLSIVKPRAYVTGGLSAGGRWGLAIPAHGGIKCYAVVKGECWIVVDGEPAPVRLLTGECLMLPHGRAFRVCSDLDVDPMDARTFLSFASYNGTRAITPGDDFLLIAGHFVLEGNADLLLSVLPPFVHLQKESDKAALRGAVERITDEMRDPQLGGSLIAQQSAYTMLIIALRLYMSESEHGAGWLSALADKQIGSAIAGIHATPSRAWTVLSLAKEAGMSRTAFAERFRKIVGSSPMEYLTRWRMLVAADRLRHSTDSVAAIADLVGYESESAFSAAFKRTMGASPREYARVG